MKAAVLTELNAPLRVTNVGLPDELDYGHVFVRVLASGICGAQLQEIAGHKGNAKFLPHLLGHEGVGLVEEIGAGVTRVKKGDKVVMHWRKAAGIEANFPIYQLDGRPIPSGKVTTFSERSIVSENRVTPVPGDTPDELCALLGCGLSTALGTIERDAALRFGESVLIVGCGGLGLNLIRAAKLAHAGMIVAVDQFDSKAGLSVEMGADFYFNAAQRSIRKTCDLVGWKGFDVVIDTTGHAGAIEEALTLLNPSGRFVMVGQPKPGRGVTITDAAHLFGGEGKSIKATQGGGFRPELDIPRYVALHRTGALKSEGLITHRLSLDEINQGIDLVRAGEAGRVLIKMRE